MACSGLATLRKQYLQVAHFGSATSKHSCIVSRFVLIQRINLCSSNCTIGERREGEKPYMEEIESPECFLVECQLSVTRGDREVREYSHTAYHEILAYLD